MKKTYAILLLGALLTGCATNKDLVLTDYGHRAERSGVSPPLPMRTTMVLAAAAVPPIYGATVSWFPNTETNIAGYRVYHGRAPRVYTTSNQVVGATAFVVTPLLHSTTYYFAVTAYNTLGLESGFSAEVSYTTPIPPPEPPEPPTGVTVTASVERGPSLEGPFITVTNLTFVDASPTGTNFYRSRISPVR